MPQDVFISYAKADAKKAARIAELLEERGVRCWIAPRDVKPGASYGDEIIRGIETSSAFLLVLSSASNESDFVAREVERAISKKKAVLPVRIENVEPSRALQLFISGTQWVDAFSGRLATHMDRLAARFAEASPEPEVAMPPPTVRSSSRWMWGAGAALGGGGGDRCPACLAVQQAGANHRPGSNRGPVGHQQSGEDSRADGPGRRQAQRSKSRNGGNRARRCAGLCRSRRALGQSVGR